MLLGINRLYRHRSFHTRTCYSGAFGRCQPSPVAKQDATYQRGRKASCCRGVPIARGTPLAILLPGRVTLVMGSEKVEHVCAKETGHSSSSSSSGDIITRTQRNRGRLKESKAWPAIALLEPDSVQSSKRYRQRKSFELQKRVVAA
jgi:hypothetical protein